MKLPKKNYNPNADALFLGQPFFWFGRETCITGYCMNLNPHSSMVNVYK
jgi:hypothetical protein